MKPAISLLACRALGLCTPIIFTMTAQADSITKSGTGTNLIDGGSWGGTAPTDNDIATWNASSLGANLAAATDVSWGSINIAGAQSNIGITGAGKITTGDIVLAGTKTLTIANAIGLSGDSIYSIADATSSATTDATFSGVISGAFGITKAGNGTLTLSTGSNTYSGGTTVSGSGTLIGSVGVAFNGIQGGSFGTGDITVNAGATIKSTTYFMIGGGNATTRAINLLGGTANIQGAGAGGEYFKTLNLTGGSVTRDSGAIYFRAPNGGTSINSAAAAIASTITTGIDMTLGNLTIATAAGTVPNGQDLIISGNISQNTGVTGQPAKSLTKTGTGTLVLGGASSYTGVTTISGGALQFGKLNSLYGGAPANWTAAKLIVESGATATFNVGGTGEFTSTHIDTLKSLGTATDGFKNGSKLGLDTTGGNFNYDSVIANTNGGSNTLGLTKLGSNTLTLNGTNTYTGKTTISGGSLALGTTGSINDSIEIALNGGNFNVSAVTDYTLRAGQKLTGSGSVTGNMTVAGGTLAIGNTPGTMTFDNNLTLVGNSVVSNFQIESDAYEVGTFDLAEGSADIPTETVTFDGTLNLFFTDTENYLNGSTVQIFDFDTYAGNFDQVNFSGLAAGQSATFNAATGIVTVIPEPSAALLSGFGLLALLRRRRA